MKKLLLILFIIFKISIISHSQTIVYVSKASTRLYFSTGVTYDFIVTTDFSSQADALFIEVPLNIGVDTRIKDWFSIYTGIDFTYGIHTYKRQIAGENYTYYFHNMFIKIPLIFKFYPMHAKSYTYSNFYVGFGPILHFWPLNFYYVLVNDSAVHSGSSYSPSHSEIPPGKIYTPANLGIRVALGNHFFVGQKVLLGVEFNTSYLFIPIVNGYYFNQNYSRGNAVIMEFNANVGFLFYIGLELMSY